MVDKKFHDVAGAVICIIVFGLVCVWSTDQLAGQSTAASITGLITDQSGAVLPGAEIQAVELGKNYAYSTVSNDLGQYSLPNLVDGSYRLTVKMVGFQTHVVQDIVLAGRDHRRIDVQLKIGELSTSVEVTGGATLITTESARISDVKDREVLDKLPLTLRRTWDYFQLTPTVSKPRNNWYIRFGGSRNKQGDMSVDGASISTIWGGPINGVVSDRTEGYQEMRIDSAGNSAEYAGIGQISVVSRSGENQLHGSAFYYYTTPGLQARNPFSPVKTGSLEHVPGGSIGGPVVIPKIYNGRDRTFFFATLEFERFGPPSRVLFNSTVATPAWRRGDFSSLAAGKVLKDPFADNAPFPNNTIPDSRINPVSRSLQEKFFPVPNYGDPNVFGSQNYRDIGYNPKETSPTLTLRFDHRLNDKASVFWRLTKVDWPQNTLQGGFLTVGRQDGDRRSRATSLNFSYWLSANLTTETLWGYSSDNSPRVGPIRGSELVKSLGLQGLADNLPDMSGMINVGFTSLGLTGLSAPGDAYGLTPRHVFQQNVNWLVNNHSIKAGFQYNRAGYSAYSTPGNMFGNVSFSDRFTGHPYADFLLGIPTTVSRAFPPLRQDLQQASYSTFISDEYKLHAKFTLTLGLRYELKPPYWEKNDLISIFDIKSGKIVVPDGALSKVSPLMPQGYVEVVGASSVGFPERLIKTDKNNFAPRVALAWRPLGDKTVFRAGFGLFYDLVPRNPSSAGVPFNIAEPSYTNPAVNPTVIFPRVFPASSSAGPSTVSIPSAINPELRIPYSMQYTATVEHQLGDNGFRISYVGTNTRQGVWNYDYNSPVADTRPYVEKTRAFPKYPSIGYFTNGAGHQYHSMTVEARRVSRGGLQYQAYYTWARDIGDLEDGEGPEYAYDRTRERAVWSDIPTHRLSSNLLWDLPFGTNRRFSAPGFWNSIVGDWQLGLAGSVETGFFLTPSWTGPDPTGTRYTSSKTAPNVTIRPNQLADPNIANPTPGKWFDPAAFAPPTAGSFGTAAKGVIKGPGTQTLHANLAKAFVIRERLRLRFELIASNVFNHPNYRDPNTNISQTASVGRISDVVDRNSKMDMAIPRYIQLALRLNW